MKATNENGSLKTLLDKCTITIPNRNLPTSLGQTIRINLKILPEISDSKSAKYNDEPVIGRSTPLKSYSYSDNRTISMKLHFQATNEDELEEIRDNFYAISSLVYPRDDEANGIYAPPIICLISCGQLLGRRPLCAVLDNYSLTVPTDVVWDELTLIPYYYYLNTTWTVVYSSNSLPNQERIFIRGQ